ncbi:YeiH family protein [Piscinibacter sp.]|uniref:YeiH family protein n=1 Tax=Piscinibacter sp. TaxID=1903157 RepID=UPI002CB721E7|nr:putative sulfate exporter family transporter [Albitalea sp.]HUG24161.1 putative sulfate exporter family transporter [Albitalea sp.]
MALRWPGAALCVVIALAASFAAGLHDGPQLLYALFFGVCFHFLAAEAQTRPGIEFCGRTVLRIGVALLGARITVAQIAALGWSTAAIVVAAVLSTIAIGVAVARWLKLTTAHGVLSGGATAICGASAALALSAVLPRSREQDRFTLVVVVSVTTLSTLAMLLYPLIARAFALPPPLAGLFLGGTIHDVAQVVGAGYLMNPATGDQATIVKLLRISLLAFVVMAVSLSSLARRADNSGATSRPPLLPGFLQFFVLLVALNSLGWIPPAWHGAINEASRGCLIVAIAALGVKTSFSTLIEAGWRSFALLLIETLWLAAIVLAAVLVMRP